MGKKNIRILGGIILALVLALGMVYGSMYTPISRKVVNHIAIPTAILDMDGREQETFYKGYNDKQSLTSEAKVIINDSFALGQEESYEDCEIVTELKYGHNYMGRGLIQDITVLEKSTIYTIKTYAGLIIYAQDDSEVQNVRELKIKDKIIFKGSANATISVLDVVAPLFNLHTIYNE